MSIVRPWRPAQRSALAIRDRPELYETGAACTQALVATSALERFRGGRIWEPAAGKGAIVRVLEAAGFAVHATDLIDYDGLCLRLSSAIAAEFALRRDHDNRRWPRYKKKD